MSSPASVVDDILLRYPRDPSSLIMVLQDLQVELNHLPDDAIAAVAERLGVPRSRIYSAASFYKAFSLEPRGRHRIDVCTGTGDGEKPFIKFQRECWTRVQIPITSPNSHMTGQQL